MYVKIETKKLDQTFKNLGKEFGNKSLKKPTARALDKTMKPLKREIRRRTPNVKGRLQKKIYHEVYRSRWTRGLVGAVGFHFRGKKDTPQALAYMSLEHGWKSGRYPRRRILEKTWNKNHKKLIRNFGKHFEKQWNKQLPRLNKTKKGKIK